MFHYACRAGLKASDLALMTHHMILEAFAAVNEQVTRVAWRHVAFSRMKDFPRSEEKAAGVKPLRQRPQTLQEQYQQMLMISKIAGKA